jgi:hypothetical protein
MFGRTVTRQSNAPQTVRWVALDHPELVSFCANFLLLLLARLHIVPSNVPTFKPKGVFSYISHFSLQPHVLMLIQDDVCP